MTIAFICALHLVEEGAPLVINALHCRTHSSVEAARTGCIVSATGDNTSARAMVQNAWSRSLWANAEALCNASLVRCSSSVLARFELSRGLPPGRHTGSKLECYHNSFVSRIVRAAIYL